MPANLYGDGVSPATVTCDLAELVALHALVRAGERRPARHQIEPLRQVTSVALDDCCNVK